MEPPGDSDVLRVWTLLNEVSEQLSQNRSSAVNLHGLSDGAKAQAIHSQSGFVLRRFNLDKPKEVYDAELERMNAAMSEENYTLLNDNRQLSALIREYEQTLENIMATFRTRAHEVQQRELTLMRQYESVIIQRETEALDEQLTASNARSESLARAGRMLRAVLRRLGGEDFLVYEAYQAHMQAMMHGGRSGQQSREASSTSDAPASNPTQEAGGEEAEEGGGSRTDKGKERDDGTRDESELALDLDRLLEEEDDPERRLAVAEWALDRESELARLERENEELRALVNGLLKPAPATDANATATANANATATAAAPSTANQIPSPSPNPPTVTPPQTTTDESASSTAPIPIPEPTHDDGEGVGEAEGAREGEADSEGRNSEEAAFATAPRPTQQRLLGGRPGTVGPFGTYKKSTFR